MSDMDYRSAQLSARDSDRDRRKHSRGWQKSGRPLLAKKQENRQGTRQSQPGYRDPFGHVAGPSKRYCRYQHRNCVYDHRLRKCREQLTPVNEVSTPDSSISGRQLSSGSVASRASRPGTPMGVPGRATRVPSPDYSSDHDDVHVDDQGALPGYIPEPDGVTTLKATATVTIEMTSSSSSKPFRVSRMHHSN